MAYSRSSADYAVLQNYLFHSLRACSRAIVRACRATKALMWRNVLLVKRDQIRGGFVQFLRLIRGCFGSEAVILPQTRRKAAFGQERMLMTPQRLGIFTHLVNNVWTVAAGVFVMDPAAKYAADFFRGPSRSHIRLTNPKRYRVNKQESVIQH